MFFIRMLAVSYNERNRNMIWTILLAILIGILNPIYYLLTYEKTNGNIKQNEIFRVIDYKQTIVIFWGLTALILINYLILDQPALNFQPTFNIFGIVLLVLILAFSIVQFKLSVVNQDNFSVVRGKMKHIYHYLPKNRNELNWFMILSISAGICEEIIFRLFLYEFLNEHIGLWGAFILANVAFALTHIGSGKQNLISSFVLGLVFSAIYYFTENIWLAVLLHIAIDVNSGILGYRVSALELETGKKPNHSN